MRWMFHLNAVVEGDVLGEKGGSGGQAMLVMAADTFHR